MSFEAFLSVLGLFVAIGVIRFGVPALVMYLLKFGCCRILHLKLDRP